jgi:hypothetical protein
MEARDSLPGGFNLHQAGTSMHGSAPGSRRLTQASIRLDHSPVHRSHPRVVRGEELAGRDDPRSSRTEPGAPLVFILLSVFVAGVVIGLLAWVPRGAPTPGARQVAQERCAARGATSRPPFPSAVDLSSGDSSRCRSSSNGLGGVRVDLKSLLSNRAHCPRHTSAA